MTPLPPHHKVVPVPERKAPGGGRMTLDAYLRHLTKLANGYWEEHENGTKTWHKPIPALRNFIEHHACTGVRNGAPVWRRLDTFYRRGKKYWFEGVKFVRRGA